MMVLGIFAILAIIIGLVLNFSKIEDTTDDVEIKASPQVVDEESTEKVVVEDFNNTLSNEDFVKKEPQSERVITEH